MKLKYQCYVNYIFKLTALVLCLCMLAGCEAPANVREDFSADGFITFLDNENFVPGVGQGDMIDQLETYCLDGKPLSFTGYHYDGDRGGGFDAQGELYGMLNDFKVDEGQGTATYTNRFYTCVALEGLELPYGINFTDNLDTVLSKLGILKSADQLTEDIRLYQNGYQEMKWQKEANTLLFTQEYGIALEDGSPCKVVRIVAFSFQPETNQLGKAEMSVVESYPYP